MKNEELRTKQAVRGSRSSSFFILHSSFLRLLFLHIIALCARPFVRRPAAQISSILYIKPDHLGDLLLATPALAALRRHTPGARVVALVGPWSEFVLRRNPDVDAVLVCPFPGFTRGTTDDRRLPLSPSLRSRVNAAKGPTPALERSEGTDDGVATAIVYRLSSIVGPYLTLLRYAMLLRAGRYDLAIVGRDDHWWGAALALLAGIPQRIGFAVPECRPFLSTSLPWDQNAHVTAQGLELVESVVRSPLSVAWGDGQRTTDYEQYGARFDPSEDDTIWAERWLESQGIDAGARLVVLHPGTGGPAKLWFAERWAQVADALAADGARLVITGGPGEQALVEAVAGHMRTRPPTLAGRTTVGQLAALLRRARLVLGVDSGPLHLAAAQSVPTVHLYGPGDAGRFGPWGDPAQHVVICADLWCSPCGEFGACPRGLARPECMERIDAARIVAEARALLKESEQLERPGDL